MITTTLQNFPLVNQRNEPTTDKYPDENADWNCVSASISAGIRYFRPDLSALQVNGDALKDAVYGQGYHGGQAARDYVNYARDTYGILLEAFDSSDQNALIAYIHQELQAGRPILITMPSQWGIAPANPHSPSGTTHVGIACGYGPSDLRVMNSWGGFWHDGSDSYWGARLCFGEVWSMRLAIGDTRMGIPAGWHDDGKTLTAPNGHKVVEGFRTFILSQPWAADDVPLEEEKSVPFTEYHNHALGAGSRQIFLRTVLRWNPSAEGKVMREWVGAEYQALENALHAAQQAVPQEHVDAAKLKQLAAAEQTSSKALSDFIASL